MSVHSIQVRHRLTQTELLQFRWMLGNLLALISLWTLMYIDVQTLGLLAVTAAGVALSLAMPSLASHTPRVVWTVVIPICLTVFVVGDFFLSTPDLIPPLVRMLLLLVLIRCVQSRGRREDLQLILLCLFMVMLVGVLTLSITFGIQMLIFTPIAMGTLFLITLTEPAERETTPEHRPGLWETFRWRSFSARIWQAQDFRLLGLIALLFLGVLGVSSLIFIMMPRFQINQALPFLSMPSSKSLSGFSDRIHFGDVVDIIEDDSVALRVDVDNAQEGTPLSPYWRMVVLDEYFNGSYQMSWSARAYRTEIQTHLFRVVGHAVKDPAELRTWTFYLEGGVSKFLPTVGTLNTMRFQNRQDIAINDPLKLVNTHHISSNVLFYQTESLVLSDRIPAMPQDRQLRGQGPILVDMTTARETSALEYPYTTLMVPAGRRSLETLDAIIQEITGGRTLSAQEFSMRAVAYLQQHHGYALRVAIPAGDHDIMVRWLESGQPGHCELFAGAFTLLARRAGYPTRVVTGFKGGAWNGYEQYYVVRNKNAHAWCEVYDGENNWLRVDPTPGQDPLLSATARGGLFLDIDRTWGAYFDSLRILWYRRIVKFDRSQQQELAGHVRKASAAMIVDLKQHLRVMTVAVKSWAGSLWSGGPWMMVLRLVAAGAAVVLMVRAAPRILDHLTSIRAQRGGMANPVRRKAGAMLRRFREARHEDYTVSYEEWNLVYRHLLQLRFGDPSDWPDPYDVFRHARMLLKRHP